ncbi:hypothetical protein [Methanobacterium petrolearium]|uniref:hypothetical protein n=1 Tax=Methanobacterium petrolearium TaxID=710190 RepID=UPI001AE81F54|nr:hypothetical protein [Methanobacterium petrolearium]MBP1945402.1 hypothetical protein [Methanobacterium petrolearium]BDZ71596.1 hypothetical protein GCM10025861_21130 [Methanobacterium petrolearium]
MDLKIAFELTKKIKKVKSVISIISPGAASSKTLKDVDLIVIYSNKSKTSVEEVENLVDGKFRICQITLDELENNPEFKAAMSGEGVLLHGKAFTVSAEGLNLKSRVILSYDTTQMDQNHRNKLNRALYGGISTYKKNGQRIVKEYPGIVSKINAEKLGKGVLMVDRFNSSLIIQTLKTFKAKWKEIPVWTY